MSAFGESYVVQRIKENGHSDTETADNGNYEKDGLAIGKSFSYNSEYY
jgi:hypothetical protein